MTKIIELIDDLRLNQQIQSRKKAYIDMCNWRLRLFSKFMKEKFNIVEAEEVKLLHIKKCIQYRQEIGR